MGITENPGGSFVFNGGTTGWSWGLTADPVVQTITRNLIARLPGSTPVSTIDTRLHIRVLPNPARPPVTIELHGREPSGQLTILDAFGRKVISRTAHDRITWDLRDSSGHNVSSGIYWVIIPDASPQKFVVLR